MTTTDTPKEAPLAEPPLAFTKDRLTEIGEAWKVFAEHRIAQYKEKLPPGLRKYLSKLGVTESEPATA